MSYYGYEGSIHSSPRKERGHSPRNPHQNDLNPNRKLTGRWTKEEHQRFVEGLNKFGKNWKKVEEFVGSRTGAQIRSHAQKFFNRIQRETPGQADGNNSTESGDGNDSYLRNERDSGSEDEDGASMLLQREGEEAVRGPIGEFERPPELSVSLSQDSKNGKKKMTGKQSETSTNTSNAPSILNSGNAFKGDFGGKASLGVGEESGTLGIGGNSSSQRNQPCIVLKPLPGVQTDSSEKKSRGRSEDVEFGMEQLGFFAHDRKWLNRERRCSEFFKQPDKPHHP